MNDCRLSIVSVKLTILVPTTAAIWPDYRRLVVASMKDTVLHPLIRAVYMNNGGLVITPVKFAVLFHLDGVVFPTDCANGVHKVQVFHDL